MIVAVKTNNRKKFLTKVIAGAVVVIMFIYYYLHMSEEFAKKKEAQEKQRIELLEKNKEKEKVRKVERIIYREIETAVDLIGQRYIQDVKIVSNKAVIVVDPETNLDALKVRYGSTALIKKDINDVKIAIDLKYILESKSNEK